MFRERRGSSDRDSKRSYHSSSDSRKSDKNDHESSSSRRDDSRRTDHHESSSSSRREDSRRDSRRDDRRDDRRADRRRDDYDSSSRRDDRDRDYNSSRRSHDSRRDNRRDHDSPHSHSGGSDDRRSKSGTLYVRNISKRTNPQDLWKIFERYGNVGDVYVPKDYYSGKPRGFAYIQFSEYKDAEEAKAKMDRKVIDDQEISVMFAEGDRKSPGDMSKRETTRRGSRDRYNGRGRGGRTERGRNNSPYKKLSDMKKGISKASSTYRSSGERASTSTSRSSGSSGNGSVKKEEENGGKGRREAAEGSVSPKRG